MRSITASIIFLIVFGSSGHAAGEAIGSIENTVIRAALTASPRI